MTKLQKIAILILLVLLATFAVLTLLPKKGTLVLSITQPDTTITIDGTKRDGTTFRLAPANYTVEIAKDGYISQVKTVTVTKNKTTTVSINLRSKTLENLVESVLRKTIYTDSPTFQFTMLGARELYGGDWLVGGVLGKDDVSIVVLQKDSSEIGYKLYLAGPPFNPDVVEQLPENVRALVKDDTWLGATP